jgi:hypothetical protein
MSAAGTRYRTARERAERTARAGAEREAALVQADREAQALRAASEGFADALAVLRELSAAVWEDPDVLADELAVQEAMFEIADALESPGPAAAYLRALAGLCRDGHGHWQGYCVRADPDAACATPRSDRLS